MPSAGAFKFQEPAGEEVLKVILTRTPLRSLPAEAPNGRLQLAMNTVNTELAAHVRSRDLVFDRENGPARQGEPGTPTQAVIWLNASADDNDAVHFDLKLKHASQRK